MPSEPVAGECNRLQFDRSSAMVYEKGLNIIMLTSHYWKFKNWPIIVKLSVVFSIVLSMVIIWVVINALIIYNHSSENQIKQFIPKVLTQVSHQLDLYVEGLIYDSQTILSPSDYRSLLEVTAIPEYRLEGKLGTRETIELDDILDRIWGTSKLNLVNAVFFTPKGTAYLKYEQGGLWQPDSFLDKSWADKVDMQTFAPIIVGFTQDEFLGKTLDIFSIVQPIRNRSGLELVGLLQVNGSLQSIHSILDGLNLETDAFAYIINPNHQVVYATSPGGPELDFSNWTNSDVLEDAHIVVHDRQKYLLSYTTSPLIGWKVVTLIPLKYLNEGIDQVRRMTWLWVLTGILIVVLLSTVVAFGITKALRALTISIKNFEDKQTQLAVLPTRYDEVGRLALAYKRMTQRIRQLMDEVYNKETLRQEAVIQALYHQMNPHFLYNALESIRMTLMMGKAEKAERGLVSLGHLLRYQTARHSNLVSVKQEMEVIQCLLDIQKLRFADRLEVGLDIDPEVYSCLIPCFIVQPLVENAIKYGESPYDHTIRISIRLRQEGSFLVGSVSDEGNGMSVEKLEGVIDHMMNENKANAKHGIGLFNIYQRIQLLYKGQGDFFVDSMENLGTVATFKLPLRPVAEEYEPL
ncbi:MAG: sensor histidine kinase [Paenibacillaceae bacterium]|nr:sensor histidine kinase [Paenibacillaceae bacterium]